MFISKYPNFTVVEFDRMVYEEIKLCGKEISNLYIEDLQLKYLPDVIFRFERFERFERSLPHAGNSLLSFLQMI